mgnify:FL=1
MQYIDDADFQIRIDDDQGANIASVVWREMEFAVPFRGSVLSSGWYPMAPWAGRILDGKLRASDGSTLQLRTDVLGPHAIHGLAFDKPWREIAPGVASIDLVAPYEGARVEQKVIVEGDSFTYELSYIANGVDLPAWVGLHTWFPRTINGSPEAEIDFHPEKMLDVTPTLIPTGKYKEPNKPFPWDDVFTGVKGDPAVIWRGEAKLSISSPADWWVVYTEDPIGVCVEPQTAPPDAQNFGADLSKAHYLFSRFSFEKA